MLRNAASPNGPSDLDIAIERERRRRRRLRQEQTAALAAMPTADFLSRTQIEVPAGSESALVPFDVWPAQRGVLEAMERERLLLFLKARQMGISWLACGYALKACATQPGQTALIFSQGQLEANELIRRIGVLYARHADRERLARLTDENKSELAWDNDSRIISLPATRRAGRSFTASLVILDEWAFMLWGPEVLAAVKPTIDAGGQLFLISTADGNGTAYHQAWQAAKKGLTGYRAIFLPWFDRPDRGPSWRDTKLAESNGDTATVYREYPENDEEAFTNAAGLIYAIWSDGPDGGNVTESADYLPGAGEVLWFVDDGYAGKLDQTTGHYPPDAHPRVFLLAQVRSDGRVCVFAESYQTQTMSEAHLAEVERLPYPAPAYVAIDKSAAELKGRLSQAGYYYRNGPGDVEESIKHLRGWLARDVNGWRRILVHPRCEHLRAEMASYRRDTNGKIIKAHDHGPDALRYGAWSMRGE